MAVTHTHAHENIDATYKTHTRTHTQVLSRTCDILLYPSRTLAPRLTDSVLSINLDSTHKHTHTPLHLFQALTKMAVAPQRGKPAG